MSEEAVQAAEAAEEIPAVEEEVKEVAAEAPSQPEAAAPVAEAAVTPAEEKVETPAETPAVEEPVNTEDVSYQAVEKEGTVTAIWEMQGQKHLRTIDPRSNEGKQILALFETAG